MTIIFIVIFVVVELIGLSLATFAGLPIWGAGIMALVIAWAIFSVRKLNGTQVGALEIFGNPVEHRNPGLYVAPAGIAEMIPFPGTKIQRELPAEPEFIFHGDGPVPEGMFKPNRIKFGQPKKVGEVGYLPQLEGDPYNIAMSVPVPISLTIAIKEAHKFRRKYGTIEECLRILNDKAIEVVNDLLAKMTPAEALLNVADVSKEIQKKLSLEVAGNGAEIEDTFIKPFDFSHGLNDSVVAVQVAKQTALATEAKARGDAEAVKVAANAEREALLKTGRARMTGRGDEIELLPDGNKKADTDAIAGLKDLKGTLVLGNGIGTNINVGGKP